VLELQRQAWGGLLEAFLLDLAVHKGGLLRALAVHQGWGLLAWEARQGGGHQGGEAGLPQVSTRSAFGTKVEGGTSQSSRREVALMA
jgi:hypothetical protein